MTRADRKHEPLNSDPDFVTDGQAHRSGQSTAAEEKIAPTNDMCEQDNDTYPEGGPRAWLCVFGSFMALVGSLGLINSVGTFAAYLERDQLQDYSPGQTGWIFGVFTFFAFFGGAQVGPIFDARGPRYLIALGSVLVVVMMITMGFCTEYYQFMLSIGVAGGIGTSLIFNPAFSAIGHYFNRKRGIATGIAAGGGSLGAVMFPLVLQDLFVKIGFAWATRVGALICLVCFSIACLLVTSRLPLKPFSKKTILPDFTIFRDPKFALTTISIFCLEWGLFIPLTYISSYALAHGVKESLSYQLLAILNAGSFFGRWTTGYVADYCGRFNTLIVTVALAMLCNLCLWLPAGDSVPLLIVYCVLFGFASGSNISLLPVCIGQLCETKHYGRYFGTCYTIVGFSCLTGIPIAGELLTRCNGEYWGLIAFTICCYAAALLSATAVKVIHCGWRHPLAKY